ncbi:unnamed protein product [Thlaspi arvense]|uniref:histone acetyltransferase n=1 Tax=Thlaspi arvense TaxID=13288 RepID=A0AAU9RDP5_THLAR|nr:unnamed protein product [Thlaspi arvense]
MAPRPAEIDRNLRNQQRWLMLLRHARTCKPLGGKCQDPYCVTARNLWSHMDCCVELQCLYPRCRPTKVLISHHRYCTAPRCPVCEPVKTCLQQHANVRALASLIIESSTVDNAVVSSESVHAFSADTLDDSELREYMRTLVLNTLQQHQPSPADDASKAKYMDVARRLDELLFQMANSKGREELLENVNQLETAEDDDPKSVPKGKKIIIAVKMNKVKPEGFLNDDMYSDLKRNIK